MPQLRCLKRISLSGNYSWAHRNIQYAPPLPVLDISAGYILAAVNNIAVDSTNSSSNSTTRIHQLYLGGAGLQDTGLQHTGLRHAYDHDDITPGVLNPLFKREGAEPCSAGKPCPDQR